MKKVVVVDIFLLSILIPLIIFSKTYYRFQNKLNTEKIIIEYENYIDDDYNYTVSINYDSNEKLFCKIDEEDYVNINICTSKLKEGKHVVYIKNDDEEIFRNFEIKKKIEGSFKSSIDELEVYYLALNGTKILSFDFDYETSFDKSLIYKVTDESVIKVADNVVYGVGVGEATLNVTLRDGNYKNYKFYVTDLITPPTLNNDKEYLSCEKYTVEEAHILDKILESRVKEGGYGSRGGVIAAARFLTLEFPYAINYFNENGRLENHNSSYIDGEGRFYHIGLYLDSSKYSLLEKNASTFSGPKIWGCPLYDYFLEDYRKNGFSCSGFVSWAMYNGGFDVKDVGAGDYSDVTNELSDLGPKKNLTYDYMKNGNYKVGDFIARDGHAALIIGIDENNIYTAESLPPKLKVYTYERYTGIVNSANLTYVIEMDDIYPNANSNYTNMWY